MKRIVGAFCTLLVLIGAFCAGGVGVVSAYTSGNYVYTVENDEVIITGLLRSTVNLVVPSRLDGYPVTTIGQGAFKLESSLKSVTIPSSVTTIGPEAFYHCGSLSSIAIPDSVTTIGSDAFYKTAYYNTDSKWVDGVLYIGNHLIKGENTFSGAYTVRAGTKTIADEAFYHCGNLSSVTIPDSVTTIGSSAFYACMGLTDVYYGGSEEEWNVISIGVENESLTNANVHYNYGAVTTSTTAVQPTVTIGDFNGDDMLDMRDAFVLYSVASGGGDLTDAQKAIADMNGDGTTDMRDAFVLYKIASGE